MESSQINSLRKLFEARYVCNEGEIRGNNLLERENET